jgi:hypothetical protein
LYFRFSKKELQDYITTQLSSSKKMAALQGYIAKCTYPMILRITKNSILHPGIWDSIRYKPQSANSAFWYAGISGIPKLLA